MNKDATQANEKLKSRTDRKVQRRQAKQFEIAMSTLEALRELGYANTTLRDIAAKSGLPLGSIGYYFADKVELISFCVEVYKTDFIEQIERTSDGVTDRDELIENFVETLTRALTEHAGTHKLWYDIRTQAIFNPAFRPLVNDIEKKMVAALARIAGADGSNGTDELAVGYAMIDGTFRYLLQNQDAQKLSRDEVKQRFKSVVTRLI